MLSFISDLVIAFLGAYLAFTNTLAGHIENMISTNSAAQKDMSAELATLPSQYRAIPNILLKNNLYQQAAVTGALTQTKSTSTNFTDALVNIYCEYSTDEYVRTTTGSGFFINDDGVILTNAHVAQFLLLEDIYGTGESDCTIRTGDPADPTYRADLLYISPAWIREHAALLNTDSPRGTGERDYALLYVTAGVENRPLPARVPYIPVDTNLVSRDARGNTLTIGGYPAGDISAENTTLNRKTASTTLTELFTFDTNYADVISLSGTPIGEHGISGGPVLDDRSFAVGLIVTKGDVALQGPGSLNAITISYIERTMAEETGFGLLETSSGDLPLRSRLFMQLIVPFLTEEFSSVIDQ